MSASTTCPYCNANLPPSPLGRGACPRCGETVDLPRAGLVSSSPPAPEGITATPPPGASPPPPPYEKPAAANSRVGLLVLGGMLLMAGIGLAYALSTVNTRRQHDKEHAGRRPSRWQVLPRIGPKEESTPTEPARLAALAYLPRGCTVVAGVHVAELLKSPLGKDLRARMVEVGGKGVSLDGLAERLGIPAGNIDHVVLGCVLEREGNLQVPPGAVLVVRTIRPAPITSVRKALGVSDTAEPRKARTADGKTINVHFGAMPGLPAGFPVTLWQATPRTVVFSVVAGAADLISRPADGLERLAPELKPVLEERMGGGRLAWAVGHSEHWKSLIGLAKVPLPGPISDDVSALGTVAMSVLPHPPLRILADVRFTDESAAQRAEARAKKAGGKLTAGREGEWLTLQYRLGE